MTEKASRQDEDAASRGGLACLLKALPMVVSMSKLALMARLGSIQRSNSGCGRFLYSTFAETFRAFRGIDFATRLRWLFDLLKPRAIAGGADNLSQNFTRSFHCDQSLKQNKN
jgi:hypothetical protein